MKIGVLGASGFVGSALVEHLEKAGHDVTGLSRPDFDLTRPATFARIPAGIETLILAAGHVGGAPKDRVLWRTNVEAVYALTEFLNKRGPPRLVMYLSSGAVYGTAKAVVTSHSPARPDSLYGLSKLLAEQILSSMLNTEVMILRLFFPFGPGQKPTRLIPRLIGRIRSGEPVDVTHDGGLKINPLFIEVLVRQTAALLRRPGTAVHNLGGPAVRSIRQLAESIGGLLGKKPRFVVKEGAGGWLAGHADLPSGEETDFDRQLALTVEAAHEP
ncbi:MAG: SDR family oxidoreductase [Lentisphaerae bacterium]|nr:SDR family oxidoreductase [Lentisphaerota bacterium]